MCLLMVVHCVIMPILTKKYIVATPDPNRQLLVHMEVLWV